MKIATWNIERLKTKKNLDEIISILNNLEADILVLTETDNRVVLDNYKYVFSTQSLHDVKPGYAPTENRIAIYTNFELVEEINTYDKYHTKCVKLKTDYGNLNVYGTIIGIYKKTRPFEENLIYQISDIYKIPKEENICMVGDYNTSFADNYFFREIGRDLLNCTFINKDIKLLTENVKKCIDHIAISERFLNNFKIGEIVEWNKEKILSDHKGIFVNLIEK